MAILKLSVAPTVEPVLVDEAAHHLRLEPDDITLAMYLKAAREHIEALCGPLITQTWIQYETDWPSGDTLIIKKPRAISITSLKYKDEDGVEATVSSTVYGLDASDEFQPVVFLKPDQSWPTASLYVVNPIYVTFTCGYGASSTWVPEMLRLKIMELAGWFYENREAGGMPPGFEVGLNQYRIW